MKLNLSLSAETFTKGERVAFKAGKNEWYLGTVSSVRKGLVKLLFDDGVDGDAAKPNARSWKKLHTTKTCKKPLDDASVLKYIGTEPANTGAKKRRTRTPENKPSISPVSKSPVKPKSVLAPHSASDTDKLTSEEQYLLQKVGSDFNFSKTKNKEGQIAYLVSAWHKANAAFFGKRLLPCNIYLMKDMGTTFRRRGVWFPRARKLGISPRLFLGSEAHVLTTLVHEMCHQRVSDVDGVMKEPKGGHGPLWTKYMRECGLTPSRYSQYDSENFMTPEEKAQHEKIKENRKSAAQSAKTEGKRNLYPRKHLPAQFHDPKKDKWLKGLIVDKHDLAGKRWAFITDPYSNGWHIVPTDWFYELPPDEHSKYLEPEYMRAAARIQDYKAEKRSHRAQTRNKNNILRSLLGGLR